MTRAEKRLFLSEAEGRNLDGSPRYPSRFILDIDEGLIEHTNPPEDRLIRDAKEYIGWGEKLLPEKDTEGTLPVGQRVNHSAFGEGRILDVDLIKRAYLVQFNRMETPRAISFRARLDAI